MKYFLFSYDSDMTMHSRPEAVCLFTTYDKALEYARNVYKIKEHLKKDSYMNNWSITEIEVKD